MQRPPASPAAWLEDRRAPCAGGAGGGEWREIQGQRFRGGGGSGGQDRTLLVGLGVC